MYRSLVLGLLLVLTSTTDARDLTKPTKEIATKEISGWLTSIFRSGTIPASPSNGKCFLWEWRGDSDWKAKSGDVSVEACYFELTASDARSQLARAAFPHSRPTLIVSPTLLNALYVSIPDRWGTFVPRKVYYSSPPEAWKPNDVLMYMNDDGTKAVAMKYGGISIIYVD
jgi:hypothetical protein